MKNWMFLLTAVSVVSLVALGCNNSSTTTSSGTASSGGSESGEGHDHGSEVTLASFEKVCGDCGHGFNGESHECDTEHANCEKCGVHEGSLLCCAVLESAGKTFCAKCGQVAGTEECCKEGAEACEKCKLHKGSPLCCKLVAKVDSTNEPSSEGETTEATEGSETETPSAEGETTETTEGEAESTEAETEGESKAKQPEGETESTPSAEGESKSGE